MLRTARINEDTGWLALGETHIFAGTTFGRESTERVYRLKRDLLELKRCVSPLIDMCNRLMRSDFELIPTTPACTSATSTITYPVVVGVMLGACLFLYARFKRAGWL